jgi:predicted DNA-binding transcriptional regulator YafY
MRRTDRLFDIIQILRDGKLHRAQDIADRLEVSVRTIYRDMETLIASGVPVQGERGMGYMAVEAITLPPLTLTTAELEALNLGMAIVAEADAWKFAVYPFADAARGFSHMPALRNAIKGRQKLRLSYRRIDGTVTDRTIRPLHMEYWGRVWTLTAWCELRDAFRVFRVDLIETVTPLPELFVDEPGKTYADYLATMG